MLLTIYSFLLNLSIEAVLLVFIFAVFEWGFSEKVSSKLRSTLYFCSFVYLIVPLGSLIDLILPAAPVQIITIDLLQNLKSIKSSGASSNSALVWQEWIALFWGVGFAFSILLLLLLPILRHRKEEEQILLNGDSVPIEKLPFSFDLKRQIENVGLICCVSNKLKSPFVSGLLRHRLYLPVEFFSEYSRSEKESVLHHELCHIYEKDGFKRFFATLVKCVFWYLPPIHWMYRRLVSSQEEAADAWALVNTSGLSKKKYAESICRLIDENLFTENNLQPGMFNNNDLTRRLRMINRFGKKQKHSSAIALVLGLLVAIGSYGATVGAAGSNLPIEMRMQLSQNGQVVAQPRVVTESNEKFKIVVNSSDNDIKRKYTVSGTAERISADLVLIKAKQIYKTSEVVSETEGGQETESERVQEYESNVVIKPIRGKPMRFGIGNPDSDTQLDFEIIWDDYRGENS